MFHDDHTLILVVSLFTQVVNNVLIIDLADHFFKLSSFPKITKTANYRYYAFLAYLITWAMFGFGYFFNTPFLDTDDRLSFFQTNASVLLGHFLYNFLMGRSDKRTGVYLDADVVTELRIVMLKVALSLVLTMATYMLILFTRA